MTSLHDHEVLQWGEMAKGLMGRVPFPTAPSRVACLPEYFMYCNYLKRLGTRQLIWRFRFSYENPLLI
jgi:hypothetical protein